MRRERISAMTGSLAFRLLAFLSLALLPIGLIAVYQTGQAAQDARERVEIAVLALTERAAQTERDVIQRAFGAARAFATTVEPNGASPVQCARRLSRFLGSSESFEFVGFMELDGDVSCSTLDRHLDLSSTPLTDVSQGLPQAFADAGIYDFTGPKPVILVGFPVLRDDQLGGYALVALPQDIVRPPILDPVLGAPHALATFNRVGAILTVDPAGDNDPDWLPGDRSLESFVGGGSQVFTATDRAGAQRIFSIVPLVEGTVYAIGVWSSEALGLGVGSRGVPAWLFPILMWAASLGVAYIAVHQLVIRQIATLRRDILTFQRSRRIPRPLHARGTAVEMQELEDSLIDMAESIVRDEARLEESVREKNALLREIHHRVKNNLQLIASIMNMQMRRAGTPETKAVIRRLQSRVLSLATVHRNLYRFETLRRIEADRLIAETLEQIVAMTRPAEIEVDIRSDLDPVILGPDQAVALALLASEAITNAIRFIGEPEDGRPWVSVSLSYETPGQPTARFSVANSSGRRLIDNPGESVGLGTQLMEAFASQLGAKLMVTDEADRYAVDVRFVIGEPASTLSAAA